MPAPKETYRVVIVHNQITVKASDIITESCFRSAQESQVLQQRSCPEDLGIPSWFLSAEKATMSRIPLVALT